ncbi:hypothetical protein [Ralstonia phage RP31]|uniref:Uncharacterized protein n=2 Tax=Ripduovirus RP12 TaxID=2560700 RepID=A0A1L7N157_9CAUD|nr:hypothetical protein FDH28_gp174 [Ralstonia phage RP12]BAW19221.1 hypothetical protein [Ralstonia phage RP12]BAW19507.1 hypothetical protein [Ralstonia phage RP31]
MAGLNDNFLLADDSMEPKQEPAVVVNAFKDEGDNGEVPELRDDIDLIAVAAENLEVQFRDLELLQESIKAQKGMSQSIATEAEALMPGFLNDERPIAFFTKHPSRTMLSVALEEVDQKKQGILEKLKEFVASMFKRVFDWFKNLFDRAQAQGLASDENKQLLKDASKEINDASQAIADAEKKAQEIIEAAKTRATELQKQAEVQPEHTKGNYKDSDEYRQRAERLAKLSNVVQSLGSAEAYKSAMATQLNAILVRLPFVQKFLGDPDQIEGLIGTHEKSIASIIVLMADFERAIGSKDYEGVLKITQDDSFQQVAQLADKHAKAIIEFKTTSTDFKVEDYRQLLEALNSPKMKAVFDYGSELLNQDMADQKRFSESMDEMSHHLYQMQLYTPDANKEAQAKAALEAIKDFNRSVIVPATQRIAFSYTAISQLVNFVKGIKATREQLDTIIRNGVKKQVLEKAKEMGVAEHDINLVFSM